VVVKVLEKRGVGGSTCHKKGFIHVEKAVGLVVGGKMMEGPERGSLDVHI
jgi:hypothetical protein